VRTSAPPDTTDAVPLTEQEQQILELLAQGKSNREIGAELFLAEKTVKNYVSALLGKLGMHRRTEAAVYAARRDEAKVPKYAVPDVGDDLNRRGRAPAPRGT
jgi:DNA-binding NarL/FixJ family response regulator